MNDPHVLNLRLPGPSEGGVSAIVQRVDGTVILCDVVVGKDGTLGVKPPRGEWLHTPPPQPLQGQEEFVDVGDAP